MEVDHGKLQKKKSLFKKLKRYLSDTRSSKSPTTNMFTKSKSWHSTTPKVSKKGDKPMTERQVTPNGYFSVYVGPEKQRFVIKIEFLSHPLFTMLLEDAESEYGFNSEGPLLIPCEVDHFVKVLAEMDSGGECDDYGPSGCDFSCSPFSSPARRWGKSGSYGLLAPPRLLKINDY